jgi:hypothetical protein
MEIFKAAIDYVRQDYPEFTFAIIIQGLKVWNPEMIEKVIDSTLQG